MSFGCLIIQSNSDLEYCWNIVDIIGTQMCLSASLQPNVTIDYFLGL
jgi:hypothetical protein